MASQTVNSQTQTSSDSQSQKPLQERSPFCLRTLLIQIVWELWVVIDEEPLLKQMPYSTSLNEHWLWTQESLEGIQLPISLPPTTGCSTLLKRRLLKLEMKIAKTKEKLQRMEKSRDELLIAWRHLTTQTPSRTLSQRLKTPTLLQRMTNHCGKSNEDLNLTSLTSLSLATKNQLYSCELGSWPQTSQA